MASKRWMAWVCMLALSVAACEGKKPEPAQPEKTKEAPKEAEKAEAPKEKAEVPKEAEADGQWVANDMYKVKFRVPDDWKVVADAEGASVTDVDGSTTVVLVGTKSEGVIEQAIKDMKAKVQFKDMKVDKSEPTVLNGLPGYEGRGTAVLAKEGGDQEIQFIAYSLKVDDKAVSLMIFSEAEMYEAKKEMIEGIAKTLQKAG